MQRLALTLMLAVALAAGCATGGKTQDQSDLVGTWKGRDADKATPFQFASVTFAPDGTFTAQMRYGEHLRADSGRWSLEGDTLKIGESQRTYQIKQQGDQLVVTDAESHMSVTLDRFR